MANVPFTRVQIDLINAYQVSDIFHPLTCGVRTDGEAHLLFATEKGLMCLQCAEEGRERELQTWVPDFIVEGSWKIGIDQPLYKKALIRLLDFESKLLSGEPIEHYFKVTKRE